MAGRLAGRIALVTGASRGIGRAVALRYAQEGATVVALARTQGGLEELDDEIRKISGQNAVLVPIDLRDGDKIDQVGAALFERFKRLDILAGIAGSLGMLAPVGHIGLKEWDEAIATNLTANWRLIRAMDPLLRMSEAGRALFVTSGVTQGVFPFFAAYGASKAALEQMVRIYAEEMKGITKVKANLVDPGVVRTRMRATAFPGEDPMRHPAPEEITDVFVDLAEASCQRTGDLVRAGTGPSIY
ncbi:MAG: SDR family NAD(P)-dependent oxidoreductase [Alphaproteobacteria bacterium]|nr:SDR family NAD(P)-dependent oxidoreductase [Alphaproteobacteria bacterium]